MITWKINKVKYNKSNGGVTYIVWECQAEEVEGENTFQESAGGVIDCVPDPNSPDFILYENLTETDVLSWVHQHPDIDKLYVETSLQDSINAKKESMTTEEFPWT